MKNTQGRLITMARRFGHVLDSGDATPLLSLTPNNRQTAMCALSNLAKYRGIYREWKAIIERYQLKWSAGTEAFNEQWISDLISGEGQLDEMLNWLRETCERLPPAYCNILAYGALCGLRPNEVSESLKLLHSDRSNYVIEKGGVYILQHFRYRQFNRRTKKSLITVLNKEGMRLAESLEPVSLSALQNRVKRLGGACNIKFGRKIHATILRKAGLQSEEIDLLAGRLPRSVFEDRVGKAIDAQKLRVRDALKEIEANYRTSTEAHITYHKHLMEHARAHGDLATAIHHQVMVETYQSILKNYSMSNSYDNV
jgi:intergrase/recombinase